MLFIKMNIVDLTILLWANLMNLENKICYKNQKTFDARMDSAELS